MQSLDDVFPHEPTSQPDPDSIPGFPVRIPGIEALERELRERIGDFYRAAPMPERWDDRGVIHRAFDAAMAAQWRVAYELGKHDGALGRK